MKKYLVCLVVAMFIQTAPANDKSYDKPEKVKLQLKWFHQFQFAGYYAAVEKGFYRDEGLDVELIEGKPGVDFVKEVITGNADYGIEMPDLLIRRNEGEPVVVLAAIIQHSPQILLLRADSKIETPQQLSGKRVMYRKESTASIFAMLTREGVSLQDITTVDHTWNIDDLINGNVDAISAYITNGPFLLENRGIQPRVIKPVTYGVDFYGDCLFTSAGQIRKNPAQVKAFRKASLKGWKYAMANIEEMVKLIHHKYDPGISVEHLRYEANAMKELMLPQLVEIGHTNRGRWEHIAQTYVHQGLLNSDYSLDGFIYDPDNKPDYHILLLIAGIIGGLLMAGFIGVLFIRHLRHLVAKRTAQLEKSRTLYRAIVQDQSDLICRNLPDYTITFVNDAYCKYFDKKREKLIGENLLQFIPRDQQNIITEIFKSLSPENPVSECEHQVLLPSGQKAWVKWINHLISDENGNVTEIQGVGRDITEQKNAREKLLASEQQLRAVNQQLLSADQQLRAANQQLIANEQHLRAANQQLIANDQQLRAANQQLFANEQQLRAANQQLHMTQHSVDEAAFEIYWVDEDGHFVYVNDQACRSLGYSHQEMLDLTVQQFNPEFAGSIWRHHFKDLKSKGKLVFETENIRKDKSRYPVEITANYLEYAGSGYIISYVKDITLRKRAEELVRQSEYRYRQLFNEMSSGIALHEIICDSNGKPVDYRFLEVNPAFEKITGFNAKDVIGKTVLQILPHIEPEWIEKYGQVALTGKSVSFENYSRELSKYYDISAYCPQKKHFAVIFHDVTERKRIQIEREELTRTLKAKNSELQGVFYSVSHDLKSPLVNIKGFSGILGETVENLQQLLKTEKSYEQFKQKAQPMMDEDIRESLNFIVSSTDKMKLLLDGLLAVSRVGTSEIRIEKLNVENRLQEVIKSIQFQLDETNAKIEIEDLPNCMGDAVQVSSVFTNLIDNALKYRSPDRDCIIRISGEIEDGKAIYKIEDNGTGISDNHLPKIFDLFHRLNPNEGIEGQGIGLTIVKRILQRQNGDIRVKSEFGKGTTFYIELPMG